MTEKPKFVPVDTDYPEGNLFEKDKDLCTVPAPPEIDSVEDAKPPVPDHSNDPILPEFGDIDKSKVNELETTIADSTDLLHPQKPKSRRIPPGFDPHGVNGGPVDKRYE